MSNLTQLREWLEVLRLQLNIAVAEGNEHRAGRIEQEMEWVEGRIDRRENAGA